MMKQLSLSVSVAPDDRERAAILAPLRAYNEAAIGAYEHVPVAIVLRDVDCDEIVGGLWGRVAMQWLFVELLSVPAAARGTGLGSALIAKAVAIARDHRCVGLWLDTYSFQARGFYERLGFAVCGQIEDCPPGHVKYFMARRIMEPSAAP